MICACGQPVWRRERYCLAGLIEQDLAWIERERKKMAGIVPWYQTPEFSAQLQAERAERNKVLAA